MTGVDQLLHLDASIPVLGIALISAIVIGKLCSKISVPKVTGYILVGIMLGPTVFNLLTPEMGHTLSLINEVAFGLIMFNIGGEFHRDFFKNVAKKQFLYSTLLSLLIFITVSLICYGLSYFSELNNVDRLICSVMFGVIAIQAAPPTTSLVMKEYDAKGPLTQSVMVFLAVGAIISLAGADAVTIIFQQMGYWESTSKATPMMQAGMLLWSIFGSALLGVILGFLISYWEQKEKNQAEILLAVTSTILVGITLSHYLKVNSFLLSLFLGLTVVNTSTAGKDIHRSIKNMGLSIYAIFFVLAGSHIHLQAQMKIMGIMGLVYVVARVGGILISAPIAAKMVGESAAVGENKGLSILSHAGGALAIANSLIPHKENSAQTIVTVILTSIFFFEILGPLTLKYALAKAGEIEKNKAKIDPTSKAKITIKDLLKNFLRNIGVIKSSSVHQMQTIKHLVKKDVVALQSSAKAADVIAFVEKHHFPIYPVVDDEHKYEGLINLQALTDATLNQNDNQFMLAKALVDKSPCVNQNANYFEALEVFHETNLKDLPVINAENRLLVGVLSYKVVISEMKGQFPTQSLGSLNLGSSSADTEEWINQQKREKK